MAQRIGGLLTFAVFGVIAWFYATPDELGFLGHFLLALLTLKLTLAMFYRPYRDRAVGPAPSTAVVVPIYNEDPEILRRCLITIMEQTLPPGTVTVVDDGSRTDEAARVAEAHIGEFARSGINLLVLRQPRNMGKREALARGFTAVPQVDIYIGVDSDTVLKPRAFAELLASMSDERVTGATGMVLASNHRINLLTRLIELRYANAFLYERAAYSMLGTVLCCCGSLAAYRGWIVHKYLDDFRAQTFLGQPAVVGDDRRLTNYCLLEGSVRFQSSAMAETAVPERLGHYLRQQSRWNRSFFRETLWCLRTFPRSRPIGFLLSGIEFATWLVFTTTLVYSLILRPLLYGDVLVVQYLTMIITFGYLRSVRYLDLRREGMNLPEKLGTFALAPIYGLMHIFLLLPIRLWSLATLRTAAWGTRRKVEVATPATSPPVHVPSPSPQAAPDLPGAPAPSKPSGLAAPSTRPLSPIPSAWPPPPPFPPPGENRTAALGGEVLWRRRRRGRKADREDLAYWAAIREEFGSVTRR
ncbi:glycosyltransferase [Actinomadura sp. 7K507]|uniref:glycosyltransferase n=1 Tax=Actinomadura sp. 7K507 TaxID=2530365 RepID=UPI00104C6D8A|nr:glycosyltransferase [Actinomadura sp. 7K507]TDC75094.1 glycosyltransferase [Actinomadura sp. 7K507]